MIYNSNLICQVKYKTTETGKKFPGKKFDLPAERLKIHHNHQQTTYHDNILDKSKNQDDNTESLK